MIPYSYKWLGLDSGLMTIGEWLATIQLLFSQPCTVSFEIDHESVSKRTVEAKRFNRSMQRLAKDGSFADI